MSKPGCGPFWPEQMCVGVALNHRLMSCATNSRGHQLQQAMEQTRSAESRNGCHGASDDAKRGQRTGAPLSSEAANHFNRLDKFLLAVRQDPLKFQMYIEAARVISVKDAAPILDLRPSSRDQGTVRRQLEKLVEHDATRLVVQL